MIPLFSFFFMTSALEHVSRGENDLASELRNMIIRIAPKFKESLTDGVTAMIKLDILDLLGKWLCTEEAGGLGDNDVLAAAVQYLCQNIQQWPVHRDEVDIECLNIVVTEQRLLEEWSSKKNSERYTPNFESERAAVKGTSRGEPPPPPLLRARVTDAF
jgi:hypothetical protein